MDINTILAHIDHTLLNPDATEAQIVSLCREALEYHTAAVCINPVHVRLARKMLGNRIPVCTVVGFPLGATITIIKALEAKAAISDGAGEIDMVANIGNIKSGKFDLVTKEISLIKEACGNAILKVIVETCLLTENEKTKVCKCVIDGGADYIKTSTGFSKSGATAQDVSLFCNICKGKIKVKAAGGMKTCEDMEMFLKLGVSRLGTSHGVSLIKQRMESTKR